MSRTEKHIGQLRRVHIESPLEEWCEFYCTRHNIPKSEKTWMETIKYNCDDIFIIHGRIYEVMEHTELNEGEDLSVFYRDNDIVHFAVEFYNGGTCLQEILEDNL